jgi:hypothetical protein
VFERASTSGTLQVTQTGNDLAAESTVAGVRCEYRGTAGVSAVVLNGTCAATIKSAALRARDQQLGLLTNGEQVA